MSAFIPIVLENNQLKVTINPYGAEIASIQNQQTNHQYLWNADATFWNRHAPVLFPIVGRLKDGFFEHNNQQYKLATHGFARDSVFTLINVTGEQALFSLKSSTETLINYPFEFEFQIQYQLHQDQLTVSYLIFNKDKQIMYYSVGAHPAFNLDLSRKYSFNFNQLDSLYSLHDMNAMLIGKKTPFTKTRFDYESKLFDNDAMIFEVTSKKKTVTILQDGAPYIVLNYDDFKLIGVWSPPGKNAPFVCLEPWLGVSDFAGRADHKLEKKDFIQSIDAGKKDQFSYTLQFK